jgi:hypothetical protein
MIARFILVLSEDLKQRPDNWGAVLFLTMLVGIVSLVVIVACTMAGAAVGLVLRSLIRRASGWHIGRIGQKRFTRYALRRHL